MEHMDPGENQEHNIEDARNIITILYKKSSPNVLTHCDNTHSLQGGITNKIQKDIKMLWYQIQEKS